METLRKNLSHYRRKNKLSQQALSEQLKTSKNSISNWETGVSLPPLEKLVQMSKIFGLTLDSLVTIPHDMVSENEIQARKYYTPEEIENYNLTEAVKQLIGRMDNMESKMRKKKKKKG